MQFETLTRQRIESVYRTHLMRDFPKNERRRLAGILRAFDAGNYIAFALTEDGQVRCYAFLIRKDRDYLLDYLATAPACRNQGLGAQLLSRIRAALSDADVILAEIEDADFAEAEPEKTLRLRRQGFYERCGFYDTGLRAETFGVRYRLIALSAAPQAAPLLRERYLALYRMALPEQIVRRFVRLADEPAV